MGRLLIIIFFFSFFVDDAVSEIQNNPLDCTKNLQRLLSFVNTMSADFKQTNYTEKNTITQEAYGYLIAKKPGKIIWITKAPLEQHIIANNKNIWIYDPDLEQVTVSRFTQDLIVNPAILLIGDIEGAELIYNITCAKTQLFDFILIPINTKSLYKKIQISFKKNTPVTMKLWDSLGYRSEIYFTKHQLNKKINSNFEFYPPDGVDVIKHK